MASYGVPQADIAEALDISEPTLRKHYGAVLRRASIEANARVGESLFRQAAGAPAQYDENGKKVRDEQLPVPSVGIFWAKCRMGWKPTERMEVTGRNGGPIPLLKAEQLKGASDEELVVLEKFFGRLQRGDGSDQGGEAAQAGEDEYAASLDGTEG
ncbi:hypothetical protein [Maricaulis sp. MIT060901]|uniref:hypothetical protein n=1 Tax=Maricaulis sp. MIT060901 TaxID=3096993 RepID=UPI00399B36BA